MTARKRPHCSACLMRKLERIVKYKQKCEITISSKVGLSACCVCGMPLADRLLAVEFPGREAILDEEATLLDIEPPF